MGSGKTELAEFGMAKTVLVKNDLLWKTVLVKAWGPKDDVN